MSEYADLPEGLTWNLDAQGVATVRLDRPERRNAVSYAMWAALGRIFRRAGHDPAVRSVLLTGSGDIFSAGADISEFTDLRANPAAGQAYAEMVDETEDLMLTCPKPVIAAINGLCYGGGLGLALCCDWRIAAPDSQFCIPAAKLGIVYGLRETELLLTAVGLAQGKRILFGAEVIPAHEALRIGLIDEIAEDPLGNAAAEAARLSQRAPLSIAGAKQILTALARAHLPAAEIHRLQAVQATALASNDYREGVAAFTEKRRPNFTGA